MLPEDRDEIDAQDVEDVKTNAREVSIPAQNAFLHSISALPCRWTKWRA